MTYSVIQPRVVRTDGTVDEAIDVTTDERVSQRGLEAISELRSRLLPKRSETRESRLLLHQFHQRWRKKSTSLHGEVRSCLLMIRSQCFRAARKPSKNSRLNSWYAGESMPPSTCVVQRDTTMTDAGMYLDPLHW
jgi:hypothetical protein